MFQMTPQGLIDFVCGIVLCIGVKTFCLYFVYDDNFPNTWNDPKAVSQHVEKYGACKITILDVFGSKGKVMYLPKRCVCGTVLFIWAG